MSQSYRLPAGGRVDRTQPVTFRFNGKKYSGFVGDTVASALLANGVNPVARSFKYHRPRGIVGSGPEEPNAIFQIGSGNRAVPNLRATQTEIYEGLEVSSVNCWPSVSFDLWSLLSWIAPLFPAGFYYKTFMYPRKWWMFYERWIRKAAGFGVAGSEADPDRYDKINAWCDVLVVGGGPAGLAVALGAARSGARVILADEKDEFGGGLLRTNSTQCREWLDEVVSELRSSPEVRLFTRTTVTGYYDGNYLVMNERCTDHLANKPSGAAREKIYRIRAKQVVIATGAIERPLVFGNNDRPGVMQASAVSEYLNRFGVKPGRRAVLFTNNDGAYRTAVDMLDAGIQLAAVVDVRSVPSRRNREMMSGRNVNMRTASAVTCAQGRKHLSGVEIMALSNDLQSVQGSATVLQCDLLAVSGGWSPAVHLHAQSGGKPCFDIVKACFVPGTSRQAERSVGAANGEISLRQAIGDGFDAGTGAAGAAGCGGDSSLNPVAIPEVASEEYRIRPLWLVPNRGKAAKQFVDLQNDTTAQDIELAVREGYRSVEHVKRYTALGFGTDQGKLGNINGMAILSKALGQKLPVTGTTTFRPMYSPVTFGALAGRELGEEFFDPVRKTAMHEWHVRHGAEFENVGQWKRPWYYPKEGESLQQTVDRECLAARNGVAMLDASTLGKIEVNGPDATEFLNRIYTNSWSALATGSCRYGLMLGEDGMVMDDGVSAKLGDNRYYMTTTTGGAAHVLSWMEQWRQTEWPWMKVYFTSVTDQWAVISVAGPSAREVLTKVANYLDASNQEFPFMTLREATVAGVEARIFRVSFSGELCYEINVPANYGMHVWEKVFEAGQDFDVTPYGTETMHVLRAEKGFIIVGQDTDGSVTPVDLGMDWIVSKKKDCLGKRSLSRSDCVREDRKQFVGLMTEDPARVLPEGAQLVEEPSTAYPVPMIGHVTSSYWSATLRRSIALAIVKGGRSRMGGRIFSTLITGESIPATICSPVFYDPAGDRQNV